MRYIKIDTDIFEHLDITKETNSLMPVIIKTNNAFNKHYHTNLSFYKK